MARRKHGVDYYFVSRETFAEQRDGNKLLEHAVVHGRGSYGVPRSEVRASASAKVTTSF